MSAKSATGKLVIGLLASVALLFLAALFHTASSQEKRPPSADQALSPGLQPSRRPTFARDIAPIIYQHCATCHHSSGAGAMPMATPFALISYSDVKRYASAIAAATRSRAMPPWLPEPGYGDFVDDPRLTEAQIRLIGEWVLDGAPEGPVSEVPSPPHSVEGWQLGKPDMVIESPRAINIPATGPDLFWNFIFSPPIKKKRYIRAIEVRPGGEVGSIHHANVILDPAESARTLEKASDAGFPGMDVPLRQSPFYVPTHFLFWKPGNAVWVEPDGLSWELDPGTDLVLNAHFMTMGMSQEAKPSIGLYFTDKPPKLFPMVIELENDDALDIPPGDHDFLVRDDFRLPSDVNVLAVYPHAHYLGRLLEAYATLPNGRRKWLIRIPNWDFAWQAVYHYRKPIFLPRGTLLSMRYHYDNSTANPHNPHHPPQRVLGGNQSTDEMAHFWLQLLPLDPGDSRLQIQEALLEHRVQKFHDDFEARLDLGALLLAQSNAAAAVDVLQQAIELNSRQEDAHRVLAMALAGVGRLHEATGQFRAALALKPHDNDARYALARALARSGDYAEALANFQQVASAEPRNAGIRDEFGYLLMRQGKLAEALKQFNAAVAIDPSKKPFQQDRAEALKQLRASE